LIAAVTDVNDVLSAFLTTRVDLTLRPPCPLDMVRHRLVRVHDAADKELINERIVRLEPFNIFRGIFDALELDRPLLGVEVCMIADTPIARATSIPISDFDEAIDDIVQIMAQINNGICLRCWLEGPTCRSSAPSRSTSPDSTRPQCIQTQSVPE
jgi:hypothetical protein